MTNATAPRASGQIWQTIESILTHLGVSWFAVAIMYAFPLDSLPSARAAILVSTIVGLGVGAVHAIANRSAAALPSPRPIDVPTPLFETPPSAELRDAEPAPLPHWESYVEDARELSQCTRCGDLITAPIDPYRCRVCGTINDPSRGDDVVVRSWLHDEGE